MSNTDQIRQIAGRIESITDGALVRDAANTIDAYRLENAALAAQVEAFKALLGTCTYAMMPHELVRVASVGMADQGERLPWSDMLQAMANRMEVLADELGVNGDRRLGPGFMDKAQRAADSAKLDAKPSVPVKIAPPEQESP